MPRNHSAMTRLAARLEKRAFDVGQFAKQTGEAGVLGAVSNGLPGLLLGGLGGGGLRGAAHGGLVGVAVGAVPALFTGAAQAYKHQRELDKARSAAPHGQLPPRQY